MRRIIFLLTVMVLICCSCSVKNTKTNDKNMIETKKIRKIANLSTMDVYYKNVAKYNGGKTDSWIPWAKDKPRFWIEYAGIVTLGADLNKLKIKVKDDTIKIKKLDIIITSVKVDRETLNKKSFIYDPATKKPSMDEQRKAMKEAQKNMRKSAEQDKNLIEMEKDRVEMIIENYIRKVGNLVDRDYNIVWEE